MSVATLTAAAACAAFLMGAAEPVLPDLYDPRMPKASQCQRAADDLAIPAEGMACRGVTIVRAESGRAETRAIDNFSVLVHESCHVQQHAQGRLPASSQAEKSGLESECQAIQARAAECFEGMGAPGMTP